MKKILTTLTILVAAFSIGFAQSSLSGWHFGPVKAPKDTGVHPLSGSYSLDSSLLKAAVFFDGLSNGVGALNYDAYQATGVFKNPINLGWAVAQQGTKNFWSGPSASYAFVQNTKLTFGVIAAAPGFTFDNNIISFPQKFRLYPGLFLSVKL